MLFHPNYYYRFPIYFIPVNLPAYYFHQPEFRPSHYPQADIKLFHESLIECQTLIKQGSIILDKLSKSPDLSFKLMNAAQIGNQPEVERLVKSIGVEANVTTTYTPTGVQFILQTDSQVTSSGYLTLNIKWGR